MTEQSVADAITVAPMKKGGAPVSARPEFQDVAMLNVEENPAVSKVFRAESPERKAATWLNAELAKAEFGVSSQVVDLTPALARVLLERNEGNRKISDTVVDAYVRDIEAGDWSFNGQTVIVSSDGMLNDGQHRCTAVVMANRPIKTVIVIGVPRETRMTVDQGRNRRASDYLSMDGYINTTRLSTAAGFVLLYQSKGSLFGGGSSKPTKTEIRRFVENNPRIVSSVALVESRGAEAYGGKAILAFCHYVLCGHAGEADATEFIRSLIVGDGLLSRDPVLYCRNRLVAERTRLRPNDRAELIFRAWNARRTRRNPSNIPILGGALPVLEN